PIQLSGPLLKVGDPRTTLMVLPRVPRTANGEPAPIPDACVIAEPSAPRRNIALSQHTQNVHGDNRPAKLDHLRPADRGLQPGAVMERGVPIADGRVVPPEGYFEKVVVVISNDGAFHFHGIASRLGMEGQFTEIRDFVGKRGSQVKIELAKVEAADGASLVRRGKIHLAKSANLQRRVASLQLPRGGLRLSLLVLMHGRGGRRRLGHVRLWSFRGWNGRCNR